MTRQEQHERRREAIEALGRGEGIPEVASRFSLSPFTVRDLARMYAGQIEAAKAEKKKE